MDTYLGTDTRVAPTRRSSAESIGGRGPAPTLTLIEHISHLKYSAEEEPPCVFCRTAKSSHAPGTLSAISGGLVPGRSSGRGGAGYMNLPSPNVQTDEREAGELFRKRAAAIAAHKAEAEASDSDNGEEQGPPASALHRRPALVPPKLITDSGPFDEQEHEQARANNESGTETGIPRNKRRSSIVVIPPMQICPGDLLVYSKVLTQRTNLLGSSAIPLSPKSAGSTHGDLDGSTTSLAVADTDPVSSRKGKNTWSLLKLFDRSHRGKSDSIGGLEEVLSCLQPCEFEDHQLSRFKGMCWADFVAYKEGHSPTGGRTSPNIVRPIPVGLDTGKSDLDVGQVEADASEANAPSLVSVSERTFLLAGESPTKPVSPPAEPPRVPRKRPTTLMRTVSDMNFNRGRQGHILSLISERVHSDRSAFKKTSFEPKPRPPPPLSPPPPQQQQIPLAHSTSPPPADSLVSLDQTLEEAKDSLQAALQKNETKRREAVWDLFQSECAFLYDHLMVLKNVYMEPLKKIQVDGFAMFAEPELLFGNLDELCCVTYAFCKEFINLLEQHHAPGGQLDTTKVLVNLFQKGSKATMLCQAYHRYALNYINALNYLETLRRQIEFCEFEKWCNRDTRCKKLQLTDLLVAPVQHIMKVPLILRDIEGRTEDPEEREAVRKIIEAEENSLRELDDKMKWLKNFERLLEIQKNIWWPSITELDPKVYVPEFLKSAISKQPCERLIVSPRRQIIMEGSLHLIDNNKPQEMYVILFDDMLLVARRKKGLSKKKSSLSENWASSCSRSSMSEASMRYVVYKQPLSLDRFFIHDVTPHESSTAKLEYAFVLVNLNRFQQIVAVYTFQAQSEQIKQTWLLKLRDTQDKWKRTLQNTVFRSQHRLSTPSAASPPK